MNKLKTNLAVAAARLAGRANLEFQEKDPMGRFKQNLLTTAAFTGLGITAYS
jgi:hypothetical protein